MYSFKKAPIIVIHEFNGFADADFIEIEGKKFVIDETDSTKAKVDDKGEPILFVEQKKDDATNPDTDTNDYTKADIESLAKVNPHVAALLDAQKKREEEDQKKAEEAKKAEEEKAEKDGEWQKLAATRSSELESFKGTLKQKEDMLGKYVDTTEKVLKGLLDTIPKENQTLIPAEFSPRQKLEYIITNASRLGAKVNSVDGHIEKSDTNPQVTEQDKLVTLIKELTDKGDTRTSLESQNLRQAGMKLTELRRTAALEQNK